jgi:REP element-mobilizing transposase RayT
MSQSLASILIHLVFSTKNREPLIAPEIEPDLYAYLGSVFRDMHCPLLEGNGMPDHVHLLFQLARTVTVADLVEEAKKSSSKWLKTKGQRFAGFYWQTGYGAFSIGESGVADLRQYIRNQKAHHKARSFQEEFRLILGKYQIEFDEHYVWD